MNNEMFEVSAGDFLQGQFPYRLLKGDTSLCEWICNTQGNFSEPFFNETISRLKLAEINRHRFKSVAHISMLTEWAAATGINDKPAAIIFHVSRCGSTLYSQLLALRHQNMVLSEVPFFDDLLRLPFKDISIDRKQAAILFDAALRLYIKSSSEKPSDVFIKADSWHLHFYEELRMLYPATPFILLYRDPWEVLQSQQRRRGMQSVPGMIEPAVFGFDATQATEYDPDRYMAHVLYSYFEKMIAIAGKDPHSVLINYHEGIMAGMKKIVAATGIPFDSKYKKEIEERAGYHAKYPGQVFAEERVAKEAPGFLQPVLQHYNKLESFRIRTL